MATRTVEELERLRQDRIKEATLGGPGLDGYAYRAALYCRGCAERIIEGLPLRQLPAPESPLFCDSETLPQPIFFGESDSAEHCDECGEYLYGGDDDEGEGEGDE